ncbi:hypothetical protein TeGR_g10920 [Tetraparma gracilis]|uniref:ARMC9 CTLH-like domain-containing protein n=1 Tax=Tetraparma gracilis TaxID=2962635 RepID=A0ABQ6MKS1_9STRA|nr:hypothetical protein TeGR_g10920 [Tetraparma gracilis]
MTCDALCQEYLLFRGYTSTVAAMGLERAEDGVHPSTSQISPSSNSHHQADPSLSPTGAFFKSILFSPEKITTSIYGSLTHPTRKSYSSFVTLWSLLSARFFSNVVATGFDGSTVQAMEDDLRKLYLVSCILHNQRDLVTAFFNDASGAAGPKASAPPPQAGGGGADASSMHVFKRKSNPSVEPPAADVDAHLRSLHSPLPTPPSQPAPLDPRVFRDWYSLPFLPDPAADPLFSHYFSAQWSASLKTSLFNLLSSVIHSVPIPRFVFLERWAHTDEQQRQRALITQQAAQVKEERGRAELAEKERDRMRAVAASLIGMISKDVKEVKRMVGGGKGGAELFREPGEADAMREKLLRDGAQCEALGGGGKKKGAAKDFVDAAESFLKRIKEINGV